MPYLTRGQVSATIAALATLSAAGSRLVVNYQTPAIATRVGRVIGTAMVRLAGGDDVFRNEPHRSFWKPERLAGVLGEHGFAVSSDRDLREISQSSGLAASADGADRSLPHGRVLVAEPR